MPLSNSKHDLLAQRKLTAENGEHVTLFPVVPCSCRAGSSGHPLPTCKVCGGSGRAYHTAQRVKGLIGGITAQDKALLSSGLAMPGDLTFSPDVKPKIPIHDYDMIRLEYGQPYEGDVLTRMASGPDRLVYLATAIQAVEQHNPASGAIVAYTEGDDFTVAGRLLSWQAGRGPAPGTAYTVRYMALYDWVVYPGVTLQRMDRGTSLGQRVLLRKRHLADVPANLPD